MPEIKWVGSPNYGEGRGGYGVIAIVDHITQGDYPGCLTWMQNPDAKASAHFLITKVGEILQLVKEKNRAYHSGVANKPTWKLYNGSNPNYYTIGIEHEGWSGYAMPEPQYQASLWLHDYLIKKFRLPIHSDYIIGHFRINSDHAGCPGTGFPWTRLFQDLQEGNIMKEGKDVEEGILIYGPDDFVPACRLNAALNYEAAIFMRKDKVPPAAIKTAKHLYVVGGDGTGVDHPNQTVLAGQNWFGTVAAVGKQLGY